jgi:replicative DNA helicase
MVKRDGIDLSFEYGKIPPQATDVEEAILGAIILDERAMRAVIPILEAKHFYTEAHKALFQACVDLFNASKPVDMLTIVHKLKESNTLEIAGGPFEVAQVTRKVGGFAISNLEEHINIVLSKYIRRKTIELCHETGSQAYNDTEDINGLIEKLSVAIIQLNRGFAQEVSIKTIADDNMELIIKIKSGEIQRFGTSTMLIDLDNVINGLIAPDLIVVAARPGMGKTAFALTVMKNLAIDQKLPVGMFSLEMSAPQLEVRLKSMISGVSGSRAQRGNISDYEISRLIEATEIIREAPIRIDYRAAISISTIRAKAIEWKSSDDVKLIIVDYIQLIGSTGGKYSNREAEVSEMSRGLKQLAKELDIPIIALSQLNRDCEKRSPPEPKLFDLRESGAIEQDADIVLFLYRPEAYNIDEIDYEGTNISSKNICIGKIDKHRNGAIGRIAMRTNLAISHFYNFREPGAENQTQMSIEDVPVGDMPF